MPRSSSAGGNGARNWFGTRSSRTTPTETSRKIVDAIGIDRSRYLAKAMPGLLAAEEKRWAPKTKVVKAHTLADNERFAPGGKLQWYEPNKRWRLVFNLKH